MEITREGLDWSSVDVDNWATFLRTQTGQRLIPKLAEAVPRLLDSGELNAILIRSGSVLGFQSAIQAALELSAMPEPQQSGIVDNYPDLEDDSKHPPAT